MWWSSLDVVTLQKWFLITITSWDPTRLRNVLGQTGSGWVLKYHTGPTGDLWFSVYWLSIFYERRNWKKLHNKISENYNLSQLYALAWKITQVPEVKPETKPEVKPEVLSQMTGNVKLVQTLSANGQCHVKSQNE